MNIDKRSNSEMLKRLLKRFDPPETIEVRAKILIPKLSLMDPIRDQEREKLVKQAIYQEIMKELMLIDAIEIAVSDQHMYDGIEVYGKLKILDRFYKLNILY